MILEAEIGLRDRRALDVDARGAAHRLNRGGQIVGGREAVADE